MDLVELSTRKQTIPLLCFNTINVTYDGFNNYAPINVRPAGGGGGARGRDLMRKYIP